jgi:hypothetical protein
MVRQQRAIELNNAPLTEAAAPLAILVTRDPFLDLYAITLRLGGFQLAVHTDAAWRTRRTAETAARRLLRELGYNGDVQWEYGDALV